jgi:hypothetical protein
MKLSELDRAHAAFAQADEIGSDSVTGLWMIQWDAHRSPDTIPLTFEPRQPPERRHDWYQSGTHIVLTIFAPDVTPDQLRVAF